VVKTWKVKNIALDQYIYLPVHAMNGKADLNSVSQLLPAGAYTTFRTFNKTQVLHLDEHFSRLEETARLSQSYIQLNRDHLRRALRRAISEMPGDGDYRVRLTLDLLSQPGEIYISIEPLILPSETMYKEGVNVVTRRFQRQNPRAKLTSFIQKAQEFRSQLPVGINEVIMVDDEGRILEGISSNFFAVIGDVIWTAEEGVLPGLTRSMVIQEIQAVGIPLKLESIKMSDLYRVEEVFITSASRAILPVRMVDTFLFRPVPGKYTQLLSIRYQERIDREIEEI